MTPEQKAAFIFAQTSLMNLEAEAMKAENANRERNNLSQAYTENSFSELYNKYFIILSYTGLTNFFKE